LNWNPFRRTESTVAEAQSRPQIRNVLTSADLPSFMLTGETSGVTTDMALQNTAFLRGVSLIAESIAMLPLNIYEHGEEKQVATAHPLHRLLKIQPNDWQTAYKFKLGMQLNLMLHGNAYARVVRSTGRVIRLIPMDSRKTTPKLSDSYVLTYEYQQKDGSKLVLSARDVLHISDLSTDGLNGLSRVELANQALNLSRQAEEAAARVFVNGVLAGGALSHPGKIGETGLKNLRDSLLEKYGGTKNAHKWLVLEEGIKAEKWANNAVDSQLRESRNHQVEEVARVLGIPRPLLMMDDTSWGSGIEQLGIFFVQYGLAHYFTCWEQALEVTLLEERERERYFFKFNERALLRGTLKDQAEFFTKALGSGGHGPWMTQNEVRDLQDFAPSTTTGANELRQPTQGKANEPPKAP